MQGTHNADREFYEGKWVKPDYSDGSPRNYLVKKERFFIRELRGRRGRVLDLGCGGGWRFYKRLGFVVGVDLSLGSLRAAREVYDYGTSASLTALPFAAGSFDYVVSSDVLGHVRYEEKDAVLAEIRRVLKPGGMTLHYIEAEGQDPLMSWARRRPDLYQRHIIAPEGHIGMERASDTFRRFRGAGFRPVREVAVYKGLMYVGRIVQQFDNEYARHSPAVAGLVAFAKALRAIGPVEAATNVVLTGLMEVADAVLPLDWAGGVMVCYE